MNAAFFDLCFLPFRCPHQANAALQERPAIERCKAHLQKQGEQFLETHETAQGIGNVGVNARTAVQEEPPKRAVEIKVAQIQAAKHKSWRKEKIEHHQSPSGLRHPV